MGIFNAFKGRISRNWKAQHLATQGELQVSGVRRSTMFEALESRTHLDASALADSSYDGPGGPLQTPAAYAFSLHPGAASFISSASDVPARERDAIAGTTRLSDSRPSNFSHGVGRGFSSVDWRAESEALAATQLRTSGTDPGMRPRRPNLVSSMGATPTGGAAEHPPEKKPVVPPPATATRVLVIEDDALTRRAMTTVLRGLGYEVAVAATVAEGVRQLEAKPDHVLLDLTLPDGDGEQVLRHIRSTGLKTRVTITSGSGDADRLERVRGLGADDVLNKPVDMPSLLAHLAAAA